MNFSNIKKEDYCFNSNYPKIEKNIKDEKTVKKLIDIYAGSKGELTAFFQYLYESFYTKLEYKELSEILENISIIKLKHIEIISQLLISMDINPKFCKYIDNNQNICNYWSSGNVKYIYDTSKFLDYNIRFEEYTINEYKELLKLTKSQNIIDIINIILKDEEAYLLIFNQIKEMLKNDTHSRYNNIENSDTSIDNNISNDSNHDKEIVNILSASTLKNIEINEKFKSNYSDTTKTESYTSKEEIQIPITDLNNFSAKELTYLNKLEEKVYSPDEIIDG